MGFTTVQLRPRIAEMSLNNIMRMVSGKRNSGDVTGAEELRQCREIIQEIWSFLDANKSDFFPLFRWLDLDGYVKRLKRVGKRADAFWQGLLEEHRSGKHGNDTMIAHLLTLQKMQPEYYSDQVIKGLIQVIFSSCFAICFWKILNDPKLTLPDFFLPDVCGMTGHASF